MISAVGDSAVYLLNPEVRTPSGEWEAWFFANWNPGACRYRSFWEMMQRECQSFIDLREMDEKRFLPEDGIETLPPKVPGLINDLRAQSDGYREAKRLRESRGEPDNDRHTDGIIQALVAAAESVRAIAGLGLSPDAVLDRLNELADELERKWKADFRPNTCGVTLEDGRAQGNSQASSMIRYFLNAPRPQVDGEELSRAVQKLMDQDKLLS